MQKTTTLLWQIFYTFLKISPVTFGGGYAMISIIEREVVEKQDWINRDEIVDIITIAQVIPGAVAVNSAVLIGYRKARLLGACSALLGIMLPTLLIVIAMSLSYFLFRDNPVVEAAFKGIGAAVIALIVYAGYTIGKTAIIDTTTLVLAIVSMAILLLFNINPIVVIIGGIGMGLGISNWRIRQKGRMENE